MWYEYAKSLCWMLIACTVAFNTTSPKRMQTKRTKKTETIRFFSLHLNARFENALHICWLCVHFEPTLMQYEVCVTEIIVTNAQKMGRMYSFNINQRILSNIHFDGLCEDRSRQTHTHTSYSNMACERDIAIVCNTESIKLLLYCLSTGLVAVVVNFWFSIILLCHSPAMWMAHFSPYTVNVHSDCTNNHLPLHL